MRKFFEYRRVHVDRFTWPTNGAQLASQAEGRATEAGGALFGLWAGQIGLERDEGIAMTSWASLDEARALGGAVLASPGMTVSEPVYLEATVRPTSDSLPRASGFYAHRWFEIPSNDWPEFLTLSDEAWPSMEAAVDAQILGFWRVAPSATAGAPTDTTSVLLLTRYATLSDWERSRWWGRPDPAAEDAMRRFRRRSELVNRTHVLISTFPPGWPS